MAVEAGDYGRDEAEDEIETLAAMPVVVPCHPGIDAKLAQNLLS